MIPRLQRFYGGDPQRWLEIPGWLFWVYARMQPVLHARESVHRINEMSFAFGGSESMESRDFMTNLTKLASGPEGLGPDRAAGIAPRPTSPEEMAQYAMMDLTGSASVEVVMES